MTPLSSDERAKLMAQSNEVQRRKYGKGYPEEMRRRANLRTTHGTGTNPDSYGGAANLSKEMARRSNVRWDKINAEKQKATEIKDTAQDFDRTEEV